MILQGAFRWEQGEMGGIKQKNHISFHTINFHSLGNYQNFQPHSLKVTLGK